MPQFDNRNLKASHGLNKHDLSYRNLFTSCYGALLPFMVVDVVGNSRVELSCEHQTRALPLNSASFIRLREHFDYFFVPYSQLFRQYDNFKTMQSNQSSMLDKNAYPNIVSQIPNFDALALAQALTPDSGRDFLDAAGYNSIYGSRRLFDLLGYGNYSMSPTTADIPTLSFNPFRLLAYQKIYYDYYRNDKYEGNNTQFYNIDDVTTGSISTARLKQISLLHYRWRRKDYFMQSTPDLLPTGNQFNRDGWIHQLRSVNSASVYSSQFTLPGMNATTSNIVATTNYDNGLPIPTPDNVNSNQTPDLGSSVRTNNTVNSNNIYQSTIQHRLIESRQRLLERMYAAKSDFSSQMLAIYGYAPIEGRHGKVKHINGFSEVLNVTDVNNNTQAYQSQNDGTFGKINNFGESKSFKFHVPEDGILMGIYSTECMPDYNSCRVDRFNFKTVPEDYFNPYYEGLGKQVLYGVEYCSYQLNSDFSHKNVVANILGFVPRYAEYKDKVDESHGEIANGVYSNYASPVNNDIKSSHPYFSQEYMICKPMQMDSIFFTNYNGQESTDCFLNNLYNVVKVLAPIRRNSEL